MSGGAPLDVSLRVRMRYEAGDTARRATGDIEGLAAKARQLGSVSAGDKLAHDLRSVSGQAVATGRDLSQVSQVATRLGAGDGAGRLAGGLKDAGQAAGGAVREVTQLGQAAARFDSLSTVAYLGRDLRAAQAPAQALKRDLAEIGKAAESVGRGRALADLTGELQGASRKADDLERRLVAVARHTAGRAGRGEHGEFANEALRASGLGMAGLRFGMSGAAAGGLAVGAGVAAVGGSLALATKQAIDFQHAMTEVGKAVGETPAGMRDLESQVLSLSRKSGIAQAEIAGIVAQGGYFNIPREQLARFASIGTRAAVGFQMRPDEAAEALGPLMKSYGLKNVDEVGLAADAVNTIGDGQGVRERNILNFLGRVAPTASTLHIPIQKAAAYGGVVESLGVAPDVAATGYNAIMGRLANANLEGKDFQRGLRGINLSGRQVKAMVAQDPEKALDTVLERVRDLPDSKKSNVIKDLAGDEHGPALGRMAAGLDQIRVALDKVSDPSKYRGSLDKTFAIFGADTRASINRASTALDSFATRLGQRFDPAVKASADVMARWLGGMAKAMELEDRARKLSGKQLRGEALTEKESAELATNPKLKAETDRRLGIGREDADRRAIVEQDGRDRARNAPRSERLPTGPSGPREPDEQDAAAAEARERTRLRLQGQIRDLDAEVNARRLGGYETTADRLRLRKLQQQYERQFPDAKPEGLPGTGKRSDLQEGVKASLASYHEEVAQGLGRTERLAREMGRRIAEDLTVRPKVEDAAFRFGGEGGARIERASLGGGGIGGGLGGGSVGMPGRFGGAIPRGGGGGGAGRSGGGGIRQPRGGASRFGEGRAGSGLAPGGGGHRAPSTAEGKDNVASWLAFAQRPTEEGGLGLTKEQAHGMVAGLQGESGANLDPGAWNGNDRGKPAGGTAQWRDDRLRNLQAFAEAQGKDWRDRGVQQAFLRHEMLGSGAHGGGSERRAYEALKGSRTRQEALGAHVSRYERPQFPDDQIRKRSQYLYGHEGGTADGGAGGRPPSGEAGANGQFDPLGGAARRYTSGYGMRDHPVLGGRRMHHGQDMAAPAGSPVTAMQGGRVSGISRMGDVTVTHPDGSTKTYRHIDPSGIKVGQEVEGGARIGSLRARDPRSTGPHLHLEATDPQGRRYDPRSEIEEAARKREGVVAARPGEGESAIRQLRPWTRREEASEPRSPRYRDPDATQLKPGAGGDPAGGGAGAGRSGAGASSVVQNFHGGFDAHEVGRRAQLEQNREVRRTMAGALHDVGHPVTV